MLTICFNIGIRVCAFQHTDLWTNGLSAGTPSKPHYWYSYKCIVKKKKKKKQKKVMLFSCEWTERTLIDVHTLCRGGVQTKPMKPMKPTERQDRKKCAQWTHTNMTAANELMHVFCALSKIRVLFEPKSQVSALTQQWFFESAVTVGQLSYGRKNICRWSLVTTTEDIQVFDNRHRIFRMTLKSTNF